MKGIMFYVEYPSKAAKRKVGKGIGYTHSGNVIARFQDQAWWNGSQQVHGIICAVHSWRNSPVAGSSAVQEYLREYCKRIPESTAREIHPELFKRLDDTE